MAYMSATKKTDAVTAEVVALFEKRFNAHVDLDDEPPRKKLKKLNNNCNGLTADDQAYQPSFHHRQEAHQEGRRLCLYRQDQIDNTAAAPSRDDQRTSRYKEEEGKGGARGGKGGV